MVENDPILVISKC